ncbi:hypothetical protein LG198_02835 [Methylobacillus arboreus]|uniref:hypothetical protein n=1 Tax=Methylobacillus arboreus TaxID=755170 RepID=UPI001E3F74E9|nr:hypothetical protein [Methylobacillus arboreus]MCB5189669.1 hypothetical protein [Methylobacillus arboreus]
MKKLLAITLLGLLSTNANAAVVGTFSISDINIDFTSGGRSDEIIGKVIFDGSYLCGSVSAESNGQEPQTYAWNNQPTLDSISSISPSTEISLTTGSPLDSVGANIAIDVTNGHVQGEGVIGFRFADNQQVGIPRIKYNVSYDVLIDNAATELEDYYYFEQEWVILMRNGDTITEFGIPTHHDNS